MTTVTRLLRCFAADETGATTVEYVAIASGIGLTLLASLGGANGALTEGIELITSQMKLAAPE
jgi:Flp pilus assembly pilin Flp